MADDSPAPEDELAELHPERTPLLPRRSVPKPSSGMVQRHVVLGEKRQRAQPSGPAEEEVSRPAGDELSGMEDLEGAEAGEDAEPAQTSVDRHAVRPPQAAHQPRVQSSSSNSDIYRPDRTYQPAVVPAGQGGDSEEPGRPTSRPFHGWGKEEGEKAWDSSQRASLWWVLAGAGCFLILVFFLSQALRNPTIVERVDGPERTKANPAVGPSPIADFVARSAEILPEVTVLLDRVMDAEPEDFWKDVRGGEESKERRAAWLARSPEPARHFPKVRRQLHAAASDNTGYLVLVGLDADHLSAVSYFTREQGQFKYDWEASEGYSELLPGEEGDLEDREPRLMRVIVTPATFYPAHFPEKDYQAYALHHQDPGEFVWAFAKRSSYANQGLLGSFALPDMEGTEGRVTLKVRKGPPGARANQLEIVEFVNHDWLMPDWNPAR